jgi:hypothetical protein
MTDMLEFIKFIDHLLMPIDEVADMYGCDVRGILKLAMDGEVELLAPVTTSEFIGVKHSDFNNSVTILFNDGAVPEFMALSPVVCRILYLRKKAKICVFDKGYILSRNKIVEAKIRTAIKPTAAHPMSWVNFKMESENDEPVPKPVFDEITIDMLYVSQEKCRGAIEFVLDKLKAKHSYWLNSELDVLAKAASKFWNGDRVDLTDPSTYPNTGDILEFFAENEISKTDAKIFARIIRPKLALTGARKLDDDDLEARAKTKKIKKTKGGIIHRMR